MMGGSYCPIARMKSTLVTDYTFGLPAPSQDHEIGPNRSSLTLSLPITTSTYLWLIWTRTF
jgi:hypothetical protein